MIPLRVYIASSFRHLHAVRLLGRAMRDMGYTLLDWTEMATPPEGLTPAERRAWMDTDHGGRVFAFCEQACRDAHFVLYLGASGQDAGVEVGIARGCGVPVMGVRGPLEAPGLMLYGAGDVWVENMEEALDLLGLVRDRARNLAEGGCSANRAAGRVERGAAVSEAGERRAMPEPAPENACSQDRRHSQNDAAAAVERLLTRYSAEVSHGAQA